MGKFLFTAKSRMPEEDLLFYEIPNDGGWVTGWYVDGYIVGPVEDSAEDYFSPHWWCPVEEDTIISADMTDLELLKLLRDAFSKCELVWSKVFRRGDVWSVFYRSQPEGELSRGLCGFIIIINLPHNYERRLLTLLRKSRPFGTDVGVYWFPHEVPSPGDRRPFEERLNFLDKIIKEYESE